jgi:hypothetical protein
MMPTEIDSRIRRLASLLEWYDDEPLVEWRGSKAQLGEFEERVGGVVPDLFAQLILNYRWNAAECEWITLLANPPANGLAGLAEEVERDQLLFETLKSAKLVQLGRPVTGNYDAVCFDTRRMHDRDCPVVRIDHEAALQFGKVSIAEEIAPSFVSLVETILADDPA